MRSVRRSSFWSIAFRFTSGLALGGALPRVVRPVVIRGGWKSSAPGSLADPARALEALGRLEPRRGLVLRLETIGVAVNEAPFSILAAEDVCHAIAPSRRAFDAVHALARVGLDVGHEEHVS